jgi:hypothetical protein
LSIFFEAVDLSTFAGIFKSSLNNVRMYTITYTEADELAKKFNYDSSSLSVMLAKVINMLYNGYENLYRINESMEKIIMT